MLSVELAFIVSSCGYAAEAQNKKNSCKHPPKIVFQPKFSDEDQKKWKGRSVSGKIAIVISEKGDVSEARVLTASPKEAAESLLNAASRMKFEPRQGCSELKAEIFFSPNQ
jgi:outer membrane biosynthesis protein TonB